MPDQRDISTAAEALRKIIRDETDRLALELVTKAAERNGIEVPDPILPPVGERRLMLEMTKLRIRKAANVELEKAVQAAREAGASWTDIGRACETTRQGAFDRWAKIVKRLSSPPDVLPAADPLEDFRVTRESEAGGGADQKAGGQPIG